MRASAQASPVLCTDASPARPSLDVTHPGLGSPAKILVPVLLPGSRAPLYPYPLAYFSGLQPEHWPIVQRPDCVRSDGRSATTGPTFSVVRANRRGIS